MARTKDAVLTPGQKELMEKEYLDFVKPSTYGNKANPSSCNSLYDDVENPELRVWFEYSQDGKGAVRTRRKTGGSHAPERSAPAPGAAGGAGLEIPDTSLTSPSAIVP